MPFICAAAPVPFVIGTIVTLATSFADCDNGSW